MVLSKTEPKTLDYDNARHPAGSRRNIRRKKEESTNFESTDEQSPSSKEKTEKESTPISEKN